MQLQVRGSDIAELTALARKVESIVQSVPGTRDVTSSGLDGQPEVVLRLDRGRAADLGVSAVSAASALRTALSGSVVTQYRQEGSRAVDVRVLVGNGDIGQVDEVLSLPISTTSGRIVQLGQIVSSWSRLGRHRSTGEIGRGLSWFRQTWMAGCWVTSPPT